MRITRSTTEPLVWDIMGRRYAIDNTGPQVVFVEGPTLNQLTGPNNVEVTITFYTVNDDSPCGGSTS